MSVHPRDSDQMRLDIGTATGAGPGSAGTGSGGSGPGARRQIRVGGDPDNHPNDPGLVCIECGEALEYKGRGRRPRYCSSSCRHRGWERRRAAAEGVVGTQVVELQALPMPPTYTRSGVIEWLEGKPRRLADVVAALPQTDESAEIVATALRRLKNNGARTVADRRAESQEHQDLACLTEQYREALREVRRLREDNARLRDTAVQRPTGALASSALSTPVGRAGAPPVGYKVVKHGGRTFHVPELWSRQQCRRWCRDNPGKAVG